MVVTALGVWVLAAWYLLFSPVLQGAPSLDPTHRLVQLLSSIVFLLMTSVLAFTIYLTYLTRKVRRSEALRRTEECLRRVFEESPVGLALLGKDNRIAKANAALCRMVGYSEAELTGMSFREITDPDDPWMDALAGRLFNSEIPVYKTEKRCLKKTGEIVWASVTASVIHDSAGNPLCGVAMIEDITDRRRAGAEL